MLFPPLASAEAERLAALQDLRVLEGAPEAEFDALVHAAALLCEVPTALLTLLDGTQPWFKASVGLDATVLGPRQQVWQGATLHEFEWLELSDARQDPRFKDHPWVTGSPGIRFYAGAALLLEDGTRLGSLSVISRQPGQLREPQRQALRHLATLATKALQDRRDALLLGASEARFRALVQASPIGFYAADAQGACTYTSPVWQAVYGLTEAESLGHGWARTLHPEDRAAVFAEWQRTTALKSIFDMEFRIQREDGAVVHVRSMASPLLDPSGAMTGLVGSVEDVTSRVQAQHRLALDRHRMASILEGAGVATWEWHVDSRQLQVDDRWAALLGFSLDEVAAAGQPFWAQRTHPDDLPLVSQLLKEHLRGATDDFLCETRLRHRQGHWVWVLVRGRVLQKNVAGKPERMFGIARDIGLRRAQEDELKRNAALLHRTGELAQVGGWELDLAEGRPRWSDETCRIHGVPVGYQPSLDEAIHYYAPEARPLIQAAVQRGMADGVGWDLELPFIQASGQRIWVRAVGQVEFERGKPVRLVGAFQDITERRLQSQALQDAHAQLALATQSGGIGVWDCDMVADQLTWDPRMFQLYGLPAASSMDYTRWISLLHAQDRDRVAQALQDAVAGIRPYDVEFRVVWPDGSVHHLRGAAVVSCNPQGQALRANGVNWDVTEIRQLALQLAEQHEMLRVTLQSIGDAVITTDAQGHVTWLNPVAERMTGWTSAEARGRPLPQVFHLVNEETRQPAPSPVSACLQTQSVVGLPSQSLLISRGGAEFGVEDSAAPIRSAQGELLGVVLVFHDVTEQRRLSGEMNYRATHDPLTGLVNRAEFELRLRRVLNKAHDDKSEHAVLFIDLDQFKLVNDACGHAVGDQLLQQVAKLLTDSVRTRDTLARLGGDEFAVLLEHCSGDQAQRVAQQVCDRMDDFRFLHDERRFRIGTSIGLVAVDARWSNTGAVMQAADAACYAAKSAGRNRVHAWYDTDQAMQARHGEMRWASRLEQALDDNRFVLYAQRIQALSTPQQGLHAEVLLRLLDTDGQLIMPGAFLPAAERFNLSSRIDRWVLRQSLECLRSLPPEHSLQLLCVNLSGQSIGDRSFHRMAIELLKVAGAPACARLCLEVTETAAITNMADASLFIDQVRQLGVRVALDDFGAGASSFGYLKSLKVDMIKIDGQFIKDIIDDPLDDAAVRCFVDVAKLLGLQTVAEYVDRSEVLERVRAIGIDHAQGFLLHRPEPIERVLGLPLANTQART